MAIGVLALTLLPGPAAGQAGVGGGETSPAAAEARLGGRLDEETARAVTSLADSAGRLGLPAEPLVQKALEGASKQAGGAEIVRAVRGLLGDMATARRVLGAAARPGAVELGAAVLAAGASPESLGRLSPWADRDGFVGGLAGAVYLLSRGLPADLAFELVGDMLAADLTGAEFATLQRLVERDLRGGVPSVEAASVRADALVRHGRRLRPGGGA